MARRFTSFILIVLVVLVAFFVLFAVFVAPKPAAASPPTTVTTVASRPPGHIELLFACGAGADLENLGSNYQVRTEGWVAAARKTFIPRLTQFYGGRAPAGTHVFFHLPFGRSQTAAGDDAEMPFDGVERAKDMGFDKLADTKAYSQVLRVLQMQCGVKPCSYFGTVDHGHQAQWAAMTPTEFAERVEAELAPYLSVPDFTPYLDAGAVMGPTSNSWQVRCIAKRMGFARFGSEPTPSIDAPQWAADPECDFIITSELFDGSGQEWRIPLNQIKGQVFILENSPRSDEWKIARCREGWIVLVGGYQITKTAAQWTGLINATVDTAPKE